MASLTSASTNCRYRSVDGPPLPAPRFRIDYIASASARLQDGMLYAPRTSTLKAIGSFEAYQVARFRREGRCLWPNRSYRTWTMDRTRRQPDSGRRPQG